MLINRHHNVMSITSYHITMIILVLNQTYQLNQTLYDTLILSFLNKQEECPICHHNIIFQCNDYKDKGIVIDNQKHIIKLIQVECPHCHKTHLILLDLMIPYCQLNLMDASHIIFRFKQGEKISSILNDYYYYDENSIRRMIKKYNH